MSINSEIDLCPECLKEGVEREGTVNHGRVLLCEPHDRRDRALRGMFRTISQVDQPSEGGHDV